MSRVGAPRGADVRHAECWLSSAPQRTSPRTDTCPTSTIAPQQGRPVWAQLFVLVRPHTYSVFTSQTRTRRPTPFRHLFSLSFADLSTDERLDAPSPPPSADRVLVNAINARTTSLRLFDDLECSAMTRACASSAPNPNSPFYAPAKSKRKGATPTSAPRTVIQLARPFQFNPTLLTNVHCPAAQESSSVEAAPVCCFASRVGRARGSQTETRCVVAAGGETRGVCMANFAARPPVCAVWFPTSSARARRAIPTPHDPAPRSRPARHRIKGSHAACGCPCGVGIYHIRAPPHPDPLLHPKGNHRESHRSVRLIRDALGAGRSEEIDEPPPELALQIPSLRRTKARTRTRVWSPRLMFVIIIRI